MIGFFSNLQKALSEKQSKSDEGFTLVELAIVLVIIGLLIGGVLKGQEMIDSARTKSLVSRVDGYRAAMITFEDKYGFLPGDFPSANARLGAPKNVTWTNCTGGASRCDGNGQIAAATEGPMFFQNLVAADMVAGVTLADAPALQWSAAYPTSPVGGGFVPGWVAFNSAPERNDNYFTVRTSVTNAWSGIFQPAVANDLDAKIDDGSPSTGQFQVNQQRDGNCFTSADNTYATAVATKSCILMFKFK